MNLFLKFNRRSIDDRQIDTLIGLSKGLLADGKIDLSEAECLLTWLMQAANCTSNPIVLNLLEKVETMLSDGHLDEQEASEIVRVLTQLTGESSEIGELGRATTLPLDDPAPSIAFPGNTFLCTGTCAFGTRKQCRQAIDKLGGRSAERGTKSLNYLIIGTYVTDSWAHESFGRKIEKAVAYRSQGVPIALVSEEHWARCGGLL